MVTPCASHAATVCDSRTARRRATTMLPRCARFHPAVVCVRFRRPSACPPRRASHLAQTKHMHAALPCTPRAVSHRRRITRFAHACWPAPKKPPARSHRPPDCCRRASRAQASPEARPCLLFGPLAPPRLRFPASVFGSGSHPSACTWARPRTPCLGVEGRDSAPRAGRGLVG
jgi:hypothetical protein